MNFMNDGITNRFSVSETLFHDRALPEGPVTLAGYGALLDRYALDAPLPDKLSVISEKHRRYETDTWSVFTPRYAPEDTLSGHLIFALRHEPIDLAVLNALFATVAPPEIAAVVQAAPTGKHSRRLWFLYEWLTRTRLEIADSAVTNFVDVLDETIQYPGPAEVSKRHRVRNNLPGAPDFCPLVRRTEKLDRLIHSDLRQQAVQVLGQVHPDIIARAAAFLLLKDSRASYAIEGERPPHSRAERWGRAIAQSGQTPLTLAHCLRLQQIVIEDARFVEMGWRTQGGFVGVHDRQWGIPIPEHVSARWQDIVRLMEALITVNNRLAGGGYDPVLAAALVAFGFVFVHPFEDGNGRIHRYLIHHVLAASGYTPKGIVFPVSAVILDRIHAYRKVLEAYSQPRLKSIDWRPTPNGNVEVLNETIDLYRYFDATKQAEFLYECVQQTIEQTLPEEVQYLARHDALKTWIETHFDMPERKTELLIGFLRQGQGRLSKRARSQEFRALTDKEAASLEEAYADIFASASD